MDCLFCEILEGNIPSEKVYEDDKCIVIKDKFPIAPVHLLVIPKKHIDSIADIQKEDSALIGHLVWTAKQIAKDQGLKGYKLIWNVNKEGGQMIFHIHLHLIGDPSGAKLKLPE